MRNGFIHIVDVERDVVATGIAIARGFGVLIRRGPLKYFEVGAVTATH